MKSMMKAFLAVVLGALTFVSCLDETMQMTPEIPEGAVSYTAYVDGRDTKAELDGNVSMWKGEEWIQIVGRNGSYKFTASVPQASTSAVFKYAENSSYDETEVMAVYPYGSAVYSGDLDKKLVSNVSIPSEQTAVVGSYDPNAAVAIAYTKDNTLHFKNAVALLKFKMGSSDIKNVTVWGDMTETEIEEDNVSDNNIYLTVHKEWRSDDAWFAAYFWGAKGNRWEKMNPVYENVYSCSKQEGYSNVIFCRMDAAKTTMGWGSVWNQTVDLTYGSNNHFTITKPWGGNAEGSWSSYGAVTTVTMGISGTGSVYYNDGSPQVKRFSTGYVSLNGDFQKGKTYYIAVAPVVFEKGFTVEFSNKGDYDKYTVKSTSKRIEFKRNVIYDLGTIGSGIFTDPNELDADEPCTIYFHPTPDDPLYSEVGDLYAHIWLRSGGQDSHAPAWGTNTEKYKMTLVGEKTWALTMGSSIREWFDDIASLGTTPVQRFGMLVRTADKAKQTENCYFNVNDDKYGVVPEIKTMPYGAQHGINYEIAGKNTVTLVLYDKDKYGDRYGFCKLLWDENWWGYSTKPEYPMNYDADSGCWWITLTDLNPDQQYKFQYSLGYGKTEEVRTFDPYTEIMYDTNLDQYIANVTYPDLKKEYGNNHGGRDAGLISAFKINRPEYDWEVDDFDIDDKHDLVIYEMLLRDFTPPADNKEGNVKNARAELDYIQTLGVNAIELMPIQEFDGNDSWGYNPCAYFAMDKAYGTRDDYKDFIDECHKRGIAVILDVVYNHATGSHPYARMYWNSNANKTASNNPWFNVDAPHMWSVGHDWNHNNPLVREHVKRNLTYLIEEYKIDGFRFDLTKGFTQNSGTEECYDQDRVNIIKEYNNHIRSVDPEVVMICEHFVDDENWELGKDGILVWRKMNEPYTKSARRNMKSADFYGATNGFNEDGTMADWNHFGMLVSFQESHDEQRTAYLGQWEDNNGPEIPLAIRMERAKINAAFFLLAPGPKMIWQFGEIGYDISGGNGDTSKKPCKTAEYMSVKERKELYDTYSMLLKFRRDNPRFFDYDVNFRWYVGSSQQEGRYMFSRSADGRHFALFGNFGSEVKDINVDLPGGVDKWYQYDTGAEWNGGSHTVKMAEGQFYLLVNDKSLCRK